MTTATAEPVIAAPTGTPAPAAPAVADPPAKPVPAASAAPAVPAPATPKSLLDGEVKPEGGAEVKPEGKTEPKAGEAAAEWKLEIPKDSGLTPEHLKAVESFAKEHAMTPAQAQKLVERDAASALAVKTAAEAQSKVFVSTQQTKWADESTTRFGTKLPEIVDSAKRALRQYDPSGKLQAKLKGSAYQNEPDFLEFLANVGAGLKEDGTQTGQATAPKTMDTVSAFYGKDHRVPSTTR